MANDLNTEFYFDARSSETLIVHKKDREHIKLFNPNNWNAHHYSLTEFTKLVQDNHIARAGYVFGFTVRLNGVFQSAKYIAATELETFKTEVSRLAKRDGKTLIEINNCYVKDLQHGKIILPHTKLSAINHQLKALLKPRRSFLPSALNIPKLLSKIGLRLTTNQPFENRGKRTGLK